MNTLAPPFPVSVSVKSEPCMPSKLLEVSVPSTPEELPVYEQLLQKLKGRPFDSVSEEDRVPMITLSFAYVEPRHRFGLLTEDLMEKVVAARARLPSPVV